MTTLLLMSLSFATEVSETVAVLNKLCQQLVDSSALPEINIPRQLY